MEETLSFLDQVKSELRNQPEAVTDFLNIIQEYLSGNLYIPEVSRHLSNLLAGHREMIARFNQILPSAHRINPDQQEHNIPGSSSTGSTCVTPLVTTQQAIGSSTTAVESSPAENRSPDSLYYSVDGSHQQSNSECQYLSAPSGLDLPADPRANAAKKYASTLGDALDFIDKVKNKLVNQPAVYDEFLLTFQEFKRNFPNIEIIDVFHRFSSVFHDHPELMVDLKELVLSAVRVQLDSSSRVPDGSSLGSTGTALAHYYSVDRPHQQSNSVYQHLNAPSGDLPADPRVNAANKREDDLPFKDAVAFIHEVKNSLVNQPAVYNEFIHSLEEYQRNFPNIRSVDLLHRLSRVFRDYPELFARFIDFAPPERRVQLG